MMSQIKTNTILFNIAGGVIILTVLGYMASDFFKSNDAPVCSTRYPAGRMFGFDSGDGHALTGIELQGRAGSREWGMLQNASVVSGGKGLFAHVLAVKLANSGGDASGDEGSAGRSGVGFDWTPRNIGAPASACLSYYVGLPKDFEFKDPGHLPGIYGGSASLVDTGDAAEVFASRVGWMQDGSISTDTRLPDTAASWNRSRDDMRWPLGKWVKVEQELVLNTPGKADGTLRLWVDGKLRIDRGGVAFRTSAQTSIDGVLGDVGYMQPMADNSLIHLSPFLLQWQ